MPSRADRLKRVVPGARAELIEQLAALPRAEVERWMPALRQARRDALAADKARRRQGAHHWYDEEQLADRNARLIAATAERAEKGSLDALRALRRFRRAIPALERAAVLALRAQGVPDSEIAEALGTTRQAVFLSRKRKATLTTGEPATAPRSSGTGSANGEHTGSLSEP